MKSLHDYIEASRGRKLRYGRHDCIIYAGRWAEKVSGKNLVPDYNSLREGLEILSGESPVDILEREFVKVPVLKAQIGDVAVVESDSKLPALGIVCGHRISCFVGNETGFIPLESAQRIYRCQQ